MAKSILIVEDDKNLQDYLKDLLIDRGYSTQAVGDGTKVLEIIEKTNPSLVLLDLGLPTVKGESVCKDVKEEFPEIPIIILTGKEGLNDKINAFELGADDYVTKPFASEELLARIEARLRPIAGNNLLQVDNLTLNTSTMDVKRGNKDIKLTPQEFKLLEYLMANKGRVLSRESLLNKIWPNAYDIETRVIDVYISYLRKKIDFGQKNKLIHSIRGFGYTVKPPKVEK
jgi:DNA-binding response OmpR family regulator